MAAAEHRFHRAGVSGDVALDIDDGQVSGALFAALIRQCVGIGRQPCR